jgi:transcriptional regulator GlxA family with amidase domain
MRSAVMKVGIVGYPEVNGFDIVGPLEVFASARGADGKTAYAIRVLAVAGEPFQTEAGLTIVPHGRLSDAADLDIIIVPGGAGLRRSDTVGPIAAWLQDQSTPGRRIAAVCTGAYGLAAAGLLDGRRATTHWRFAADLQGSYPKIDVDPDLIYVRDGNIYTSGGISAGVDLALALVEQDLGPKAALAVAREMVVFLKRSGGQHQYSEPLQFQVKSGDRFADLLAWVNGALAEDLSVPRLAQSVCLGPRQFARAFQQAVGLSPAAYVERLRIDRAAESLSATNISIDRAAAQVGYRSADVFRRAFERRFGVSPGEYRRRFSTAGSAGTPETRHAHA